MRIVTFSVRRIGFASKCCPPPTCPSIHQLPTLAIMHTYHHIVLRRTCHWVVLLWKVLFIHFRVSEFNSHAHSKSYRYFASISTWLRYCLALRGISALNLLADTTLKRQINTSSTSTTSSSQHWGSNRPPGQLYKSNRSPSRSECVFLF